MGDQLVMFVEDDKRPPPIPDHVDHLDDRQGKDRCDAGLKGGKPAGAADRKAGPADRQPGHRHRRDKQKNRILGEELGKVSDDLVFKSEVVQGVVDRGVHGGRSQLFYNSRKPSQRKAGRSNLRGRPDRGGAGAVTGRQRGTTPPRMFETRSESWQRAGLAGQLSPAAGRRALRNLPLLLALFAGVLVVFSMRYELLGVGPPPCSTPGHCPAGESDVAVRVVAVVLLVLLGSALAREAGRALRPVLFRRLEPATAGTVGFLVRLATVVAVLLVALVVAGLQAKEALAYGGAFTAVISVVVGLAAQQTLGNFFAGTVLLTAQPFRVGERVRLQGGPLGGQVEGVVSSLGLLYTTLAVGGDEVMVPNSVVLSAAIRPLREPDSVALRVRLPLGTTPLELQERLASELKTPLRGAPRVTLEELDERSVVVQIVATPRRAADRSRLSSELTELAAAQRRELAAKPVTEEEK